MRLENIILKIDKEIKLLREKENIEDEETEFLENFINNTRLKGIENMVQIGLDDFLIASISTYKNKLSYEEILSFVDNISDFIRCSSLDEINELINIGMAVVEFLNDNNYSYQELSDDKKKYIGELILKIVDEDMNAGHGLIDACEYINTFLIEPEAIENPMRLVQTFKTMKYERASIVNDLQELEEKFSKNISSKRSKKAQNKMMKENYNMKNINDSLDDIRRYCDRKIKEEKSRKRELRKGIGKYEELKKLLIKESQNKEITNVKSMLEKTENEKIQKSIIVYVDSHNEKYYNSIENEYELVSIDNQNKIKTLLNKYNLDATSEEIGKMSSYNDLVSILNILRSLSIKNEDIMVRILTITDLDIVMAVDKIVKSGILTKEFVIRNIQIFNKDVENSLYENLVKNIKLFKDNEINPTMISKYNQELFITDYKIIEKNIKIINNLKLKDALKKSTSFKFLTSENLDNNIKQLKSMNLYDNVLENIDILDINEIGVKRIKIILELECDITCEQIVKIINNREFIIADDALDEYIIDEKVLSK